MIWESSYWKEELIRHARRLRRRQTIRRWGDRTSAGLEKDVMVGFYSIRKLIEARKVSDEIRDHPLCLQAYLWTGNPVTYMNWDKIERGYDLERPVPVTRPVTWIANQLIHSFVFMPCFDDDGKLDSILFNSDHTRHQHLYGIHVNHVITLFEEVGTNDPALTQLQFNPTTNNYDVSVGPTMELPSNNSMQRTER